MKLTGLENIYKELKVNNEDYFIFTFRKNNVVFDILFDIHKQPFELHFLQKHNDFHFGINVDEYFRISTSLRYDIYIKLCEILNIKYNPNNRFSTFEFFEEFNRKIPQYFQRKKEKQELLKFYMNSIEDPNKLYFEAFIEWGKMGNKRHVTDKNLEKTRILYDEHYERCKRENISIKYTSLLNSHDKVNDNEL